MRWALYLMGVAMAVAVGAWSYQVTYATQDAFREVSKLRRELAREREAITVLQAEWAWLTAPERLAALAKEHEAELGLAPMEPERFARIDEIETPPVDDGLDPVALIGMDEVGPVTLPNPAAAPSPQPRPVRLAEGAE